MTAKKLWPQQLQALHALFHLYSRRFLDVLKRGARPATQAKLGPPARSPGGTGATHGPRTRTANVEMMATQADLEEVDRLRQRVGMTRERFESWLASANSPIGRRGAELRTISDCDRVRCAFRAMLKRAEMNRLAREKGARGKRCRN